MNPKESYSISDFKKVGNSMLSKDNRYKLSKDSQGFIYPCYWFYKSNITEEEGNFWTSMVHISYDYSFTFEGALQVLNMVLRDTWKQGQGRHLNGLEEETMLIKTK